MYPEPGQAPAKADSPGQTRIGRRIRRRGSAARVRGQAFRRRKMRLVEQIRCVLTPKRCESSN
jgi:hypothetical protein